MNPDRSSLLIEALAPGMLVVGAAACASCLGCVPNDERARAVDGCCGGRADVALHDVALDLDAAAARLDGSTSSSA